MTDLFCHPYLPSTSYCFSNKLFSSNNDRTISPHIFSCHSTISSSYTEINFQYLNFQNLSLVFAPSANVPRIDKGDDDDDDDDDDDGFLSIIFILLVIRKGRKVRQLYNDVTLVYINYGVYRMITIPICCYLEHLRHAVIFP